MKKALDIAKYIISKCTKEQKPITNLQLQNILYYVQKEFIEIGKVAFNDEIEAWQFGPVVPYVYRQYCGFGSIPIFNTYDISLKQDECDMINHIVNKKREVELWDIADDIQQQGKAWDLIYQDGIGDHQVIPTALIRSKG